MPKTLRIIFGVSAIGLILFIALVFLSLRLVKKSLPETSGEIELAGLEKNVTVYRDNYGVPHIFATSESDLWFAAGYVVAQDRLWQMDLARRAVRGTLAEIFGEPAFERDKFLRTWGFRRIAKSIAQSLSPQSRLVLEAYAAGVNRFISTNRDRLPIEFSMLGYKPELWEIEDSIGISRLMAFQLCYSWFHEATLSRIAEQYGLPMALELFPPVSGSTPVIVSKIETVLPAGVDDFLDLARNTREFLGVPPGIVGSNSWVVSGEKSASGKPMLANDPHLGLRLPPIWYEMHLAGGGLDVTGVTLPGAPGVVIGHNRAIAWGFTNGMIDDLDFYSERLHPTEQNKYWDGQDWKEIAVIKELINVKGRDKPERFNIRLTERGPIVNSIHDDLLHDSIAVSIRWTGFETTDEFRAILSLNRAGNWDEFQQAMRHFTVPCQNVVYADTAGNIGYWACGAVPIRRDGKGNLPYRGWENDGDWLGFIPFEEMPHAFNPLQNFIATANNKMFAQGYPYYISTAWEPTSRIERITELLSNKDKLSVDDFRQIQFDQVSNHAKYMLPKMLRLLDENVSNGAEQNALTEQEQHARRLLSQWNGDESVESVPATIFNVWEMELLQATLKDEVGDLLFKSYVQWATFATRALEFLVDRPESQWFDNQKTEAREDGYRIARQSFKSALNYLQQNLSELIGDWQWGELHEITLTHTFGQQKPLDQVFNFGPISLGGSANTIFKTEYRLDQPYAVAVGPSVRMIVDMAAPEQSFFILPGGQSGQPFSPHYSDQLERWRDGRYRELPMNREKIITTCQEILHLTPGM